MEMGCSVSRQTTMPCSTMASSSAPSPPCGTDLSEVSGRRQKAQLSLLEGTTLIAAQQ